jgi:hypothetical protein
MRVIFVFGSAARTSGKCAKLATPAASDFMNKRLFIRSP